MKILFLSALLFAVPADGGGGDREKGLQLYSEGRYEEAAASFRLAIAKDSESAELHYNLALASWRAGDLATAETAVEKYAALGGNPRADLHAGLLGAVRYEEAKELEQAADAAMQPPSDPEAKPLDPLLILGQALVKAQQAKGHFVRGASKQHSPELLRNLERTLRYIEELEQKIEELKKQREEQQDNEEDNKDEQKSEDEPKDDQKKESEEDENEEKGEGKENEQDKGEQNPDESENKEGSQDPSAPEPKNQPEGGDEKEGEQPPPEQQEPQEQPGESETPESSEEQQPEPQPRHDAPGESAEGRELSPEQTQRLFEQLSELEGKLEALRNRAKSRRKPVERDW